MMKPLSYKDSEKLGRVSYENDVNKCLILTLIFDTKKCVSHVLNPEKKKKMSNVDF